MSVLTLLNGQSCTDHRALFEPENQDDVAQLTYPTPPPTPNPFATPTATPNPFATPTPFGATPSPQPSATFGPHGNSTTTLYQTPPPQPGASPGTEETPLPIPTATPNPFDQKQPFKDLGIRLVGSNTPSAPLDIADVELITAEFSGTSGFQQMIKPSSEGSSLDAD